MLKRKNNINWMFLSAVIIVVISFIFFLISLNLDSFLVLQEKEIPVIVRIKNYTALNLSKNETMLNLGSVSKGSSGQRNLSINNNYPFSTIFEFDLKGNISNLLVFEEVIFLEPKESREVIFRTKIIEDEKLGDYIGIITIKIKKLPQ